MIQVLVRLVILLSLPVVAGAAPGPGSPAHSSGSPPAPPKPVAHEDRAFGVTIADEFRWMEAAGPSLDEWIAAENAYARATLAALPGRAVLRDRIHELWTTGVAEDDEVLDQRAGRTLLIDWALDRPRLTVRDQAGDVRLLHDPLSPVEPGAQVVRASTRISPDGGHAAVGFVDRGQSSPRIRIVELSTGRWLPEVLTPPLWADASGFYVAWTDAEHLLWVRNPRRTADLPDSEREYDGHLYLHRIGTTHEEDVAVFGTSLDDGIAARDTPYPAVSSDGRWWIVLLRRPSGRALWIAPASGGGKAVRFREALRTDAVFRGFGVRERHLWAVVAEGPRHRLVRVDLDDPRARPQAVLDGAHLPGAGVLSGLAVARDGIWVGRRDGAASSLWRLGDADGIPVRVRLPRVGVIADLQPGPDGHGARFRLESVLQPGEWLIVGHGGTEARPTFESSSPTRAGGLNASITTAEAPARDGVLVPVTVLHPRDAPRNGSAYVRMHVYGCFGTPLDPFFDPANAAWLERGGIVVYAHVRGGGENGSAWHEAAKVRGRATAYEDAADVAEYLVRSGWTRPGRIALTGESCGAANAGTAALMRPELFAAAALIVGGIDEWRAWSETASGARSVGDLGDPRTAEGVRRMVAASPYHRLLRGVRRPALFLFNGGTDYTVPLWMGAKFVARARATGDADTAPVLFRVERDAGHSGPPDLGIRADVYADELAFMLRRMGHPDFQPGR